MRRSRLWHSGRHDPRRQQAGAHRARCLPTRLPRHLRHAHHGARRPRHPRGGRPHAPAHAWRAVHQGQPLCRAHLQRRACADAAQARGRQGRRALRARELGGGAGRHQRAAQVHRGPRAAGHPALQLRRHHGPGAGRRHGRALLPQTGRQPAGPHHLQHGRWRRAGRHLRRQDRHACGAVCAQPVDPHLGQQPHHQQRALLDLCAAGQTRRCTAHLH